MTNLPTSSGSFAQAQEYIDRRVSAAKQTLLLAELAASNAAAARLTAAEELQELLDAQKQFKLAIRRVLEPDWYRNSRRPPIHCLPDDILTEAFTWTLPWYHARSVRRPEIPNPAYAIAAVCKHWRSVALHTSSLWAKVRVAFDPDSDTHLTAKLSTALERCKAGPMELALISAPGENCDLDASVESLIARILSRSDGVLLSWGDMTVRFSTSILPLILSNMPLLSEFSFSQHEADPSTYSIGEYNSSIKVLTLSPNLRVLDLGLISINFIHISTLPKLEIFRTQCVLSFSQVCELCHTWPYLRELMLNGVRVLPTDKLGDLPVFRSLRTLACHNSGHAFNSLFASSHLPIVDDLFLEIRTHTAATSILNLLSSGSWLSIRTLTLTGRCVPMITKSFESLPHVVEIRIMRLPSDEMGRLLEEWKGLSLLRYPRRLRCLKLVACGFGNDTRLSLLAYLQHRNSGTSIVDVAIDTLVIMQEPETVTYATRFPDWLLLRLRQIVNHVSLIDVNRKICITDV